MDKRTSLPPAVGWVPAFPIVLLDFLGMLALFMVRLTSASLLLTVGEVAHASGQEPAPLPVPASAGAMGSSQGCRGGPRWLGSPMTEPAVLTLGALTLLPISTRPLGLEAAWVGSDDVSIQIFSIDCCILAFVAVKSFTICRFTVVGLHVFIAFAS